MSSKTQTHLQDLRNKSIESGIDYEGEFIDAVVDLHESGANRASVAIIVRILLAVIVIILASLALGLIAPEYKGSIDAIQFRGFAIPFLVAAIGVIVADVSFLSYAAFKMSKHQHKDIIFNGMRVTAIPDHFNEITDPVVREHRLESVADPGYPWKLLTYSSNKARIFKALRPARQFAPQTKQVKFADATTTLGAVEGNLTAMV